MVGTAVKYLSLNFHPSEVISFDEDSSSYLECSCHNNWVFPKTANCDEPNDNCEILPIIKEYDFDFDITTVNQARVRLYRA